jgi:hypothetical protein
MDNDYALEGSAEENDLWLIRVPAMLGESFGHYLGRFRRANYLTSSQLCSHARAWLHNCIRLGNSIAQSQTYSTGFRDTIQVNGGRCRPTEFVANAKKVSAVFEDSIVCFLL